MLTWHSSPSRYTYVSSKPWETIIFWLIGSILLTQHSTAQCCTTCLLWKSMGKRQGGWIIMNTTVVPMHCINPFRVSDTLKNFQFLTLKLDPTQYHEEARVSRLLTHDMTPDMTWPTFNSMSWPLTYKQIIGSLSSNNIFPVFSFTFLLVPGLKNLPSYMKVKLTNNKVWR